MSQNPYRSGDFVWSHYPRRENPARPGPRHIGYVAASVGVGHAAALWLAYTTSQPWVGPQPVGVYSIDRSAAAGMGQPKPFTLDLRRVAAVPVTLEWFPELDTASHGIIGRAPEHLRVAYEIALTELARRHPENIERLGPASPRPRR